MAGLSESSAIVCVGPPLSRSGPVIRGSAQKEVPVVTLQPAPVTPHDPSWSMLCPSSVMVPLQLRHGRLSDSMAWWRMVLTIVTGPEEPFAMAAPAWAPLPLNVQLNTFREPLPATSMAPPTPLVPVVLAAKVLLVTVAVPEAKMAPPLL